MPLLPADERRVENILSEAISRADADTASMCVSVLLQRGSQSSTLAIESALELLRQSQAGVHVVRRFYRLLSIAASRSPDEMCRIVLEEILFVAQRVSHDEAYSQLSDRLLVEPFKSNATLLVHAGLIARSVKANRTTQLEYFRRAFEESDSSRELSATQVSATLSTYIDTLLEDGQTREALSLVRRQSARHPANAIVLEQHLRVVRSHFTHLSNEFVAQWNRLVLLAPASAFLALEGAPVRPSDTSPLQLLHLFAHLACAPAVPADPHWNALMLLLTQIDSSVIERVYSAMCRRCPHFASVVFALPPMCAGSATVHVEGARVLAAIVGHDEYVAAADRLLRP